MTYKIAYLGHPFKRGSIFRKLSTDNDVILRIISKIVGRNVSICSVREADLVLVFPYIQWEKYFQRRSRIFVKLWKWGVIDKQDILIHSLGLKGRSVIVISPENLDRCHWERFGWMLRISNLPRLTFWPKEFDTAGMRYPYWYNYVQWPEFPRESTCYDRFGVLYDLKKLMQPLLYEEREERVVCISSHDQFPRSEILSRIKEILPVDIYGRGGEKFEGPKLKIMRKYKYCLTPENSLGFGYCSEKIPEAWIAGCIPVGIFPQPFTDFNNETLLWDDFTSAKPYEQPLLKQCPNLSGIISYIANIIHKFPPK